MKIRIKGNSLRLRLSQTEVNNMNVNGQVQESISFLTGKLIYKLTSANVDSVEAYFLDNEIEVKVPKSKIAKWCTTADQIGIEQNIELNNNEQLMVLIEKDFACLTERPSEDESDNFPNPLAKHNC